MTEYITQQPYSLAEEFLPKSKVRRSFTPDAVQQSAAEAAMGLQGARRAKQDTYDNFPTGDPYATSSDPRGVTPEDVRSSAIFRPQPEVGGRPMGVAANVANEVVKRGNIDDVARMAWQREASINGNPAGDASAPQAYIDSWKGQYAAGENTGPFGDMFRRATEQTMRAQGAADQQRAAAEASARQGAAIRATAPDVMSTNASLINGALNRPPPSAPRASAPPARDDWRVQPSQGNESADDILTIRDGAGNVRQIGRADWDKADPAVQATWRVVNAENGPAFRSRNPGMTPQYPTASTDRQNLPDRGNAPVVKDNLPYTGQTPGATNYNFVDQVLNNYKTSKLSNETAYTDPSSTGRTAAPAAPAAEPAKNGDFHAYARAKAQQYGLDPDIFERQITQESGWKPDAHSSVGAHGLGQFMPQTAKDYGVDVNDPYSSLDGAARYMKDNLARNKGDYRLALAAYNAGQGNVDKYGEGVFQPDFAHGQTRDYVNIILGKH